MAGLCLVGDAAGGGAGDLADRFDVAHFGVCGVPCGGAHGAAVCAGGADRYAQRGPVTAAGLLSLHGGRVAAVDSLRDWYEPILLPFQAEDADQGAGNIV